MEMLEEMPVIQRREVQDSSYAMRRQEQRGAMTTLLDETTETHCDVHKDENARQGDWDQTQKKLLAVFIQ